MRTLLLGLDGYDPAVQENAETPNIDAIGEGFEIDTHGNSGPSWASVMTGVPPDVHGVRQLNPQSSSQTWEGTSIWEKVDGYTGIANVPLTYPPDKDIDGWMVTGMMTPRRSIYTVPRTLYKQLDGLGYHIDIWVDDHQNHPHGHYGTVPFEMDDEYRHALVEQAYDVIDARGRCFEWLVENEPVDLAFLCFTILDRVQHLMMHERDVVHEFYGLVDDQVGRILDAVPDDVDVYVTSDHGFVEVDIPTTGVTGEHRMDGFGTTNTGEKFGDLEELHELVVESVNRPDGVEGRLEDLGYLE